MHKPRCWPWQHDWNVRHVTTAFFDTARGIIKTCKKCGKEVMK